MKSGIPITITLLIFLLAGNFAHACGAAMQVTSIQCTTKSEFLTGKTCLDENCTYTAENGAIGGPGFTGYEIRYTNNAIYYVDHTGHDELAADFIERACAEDTKDLQKIILDNGTIGKAIPYSVKVIAELEQGKSDIQFDKCRYTDYSLSTSKNWIFTHERYTSYCDAWFDPSCGGSAPNITNYTIALATHPQQISGDKIVPILGPILPMLAIVGLFTMKGRTPTRRKLLAAIQPTRKKLLILVILSVVLFLLALFVMPRIDLLGTLGVAAWIYLVLSIIHFFRTK